MRYIVINDDNLRTIIDKKDELVNEGKELEKQSKELEEKKNKIILKLNRLNDKANPLIKKYQTETLEEFEEYSRLYLSEDKTEMRLEIINQLEEFKEYYRKQEEDKKNKLNGVNNENINTSEKSTEPS